MTAEECEIVYQTCGTQSFGGLDRGRVAERNGRGADRDAAAFLYAETQLHMQPASGMLTQVFWDEPGFTPIVVQRDRLSRSAKVMVYSYQEQGE